MTPSLKSRLLSPFIEPYARYHYADILHAMRLGIAVVSALLINKLTGLPHGEWTSITVFIILGLLQYQGAIYTKARERVLGTLLGILVGLGLLWLSSYLTAMIGLYYLLIGIISGVIGYYAIKQLGYIGLLTGITMCMIISNSSNMGSDGIYRALNVLIGTLISVATTIVLPLKATLMWRFLLSNNLDACANIYDGVEAHISNVDSLETASTKTSNQNSTDTDRKYYVQAYDEEQGNIPVDLGATTVTTMSELSKTSMERLVDDHMVAQFKKINKRLLRVRGHIAATAKESKIDTQALDQIQRTHRNIIGTIDLLLSTAPKLKHTPIDEENRILLEHYHRELTQAMRHIAAVLRSPSDEVFRPITRIQVSNYPSVHLLDFEWQGYFWLTQTLQAQLQSLSDLLQLTKPQWFSASGLRYQRQEQRRIHARGGESDLDL